MRSWLAAAAAALVLAGCGSAAARPTTRPRAPTADSATVSGPGRLRPGPLRWSGIWSREMIFPPGTRPASLRSVPRALRDPGPFGKGSARAERLLLAPAGPAAVWAAVLPHPPFNEPTTRGGYAAQRPRASSTLLPAPEAGDRRGRGRRLGGTVVPGTTLIAAYAFATSRPVRTAAEHLDPGRFLRGHRLRPRATPHRGAPPRARSPRPPSSPGWPRSSTGTPGDTAGRGVLPGADRPATNCGSSAKQSGGPAVTARAGMPADRIDRERRAAAPGLGLRRPPGGHDPRPARP